MNKKAIISGISGQDGAFLAKLLLEKGYSVLGTSRDSQACTFENLKQIKIFKDIELVTLSPTDLGGVKDLISKCKPTEVYNLSGQSSVGLSFEQPHGTMESIIMGTLNFLEAIRFNDSSVKFYNAGSSEMFGSSDGPVSDRSVLSPKSPYAVARAASFFEVANYREAYNLYAVTGILFNHESPFRGKNFVTSKIIKTAVRIKKGSTEKLELGNISIKRDWGWAPEYMEAIWKMLQMDKPQDIVIASGRTHSLEMFLELTFKHLGLYWKDHVVLKEHLKRPSDLDAIYADVTKAKEVLQWQAKLDLKEIVTKLVEFELGASLAKY